MDLGLSGKRAAVMAASEGIGRAAALALSREGARVAICARDEEKLNRAAKEIESETGNEVLALSADVSKADDVVRFMDAAAARFGGLDALVVNAGGPPAGTFADVDDAAWERSFNLVVMSYVRAVRAALPHLRTAGGGSVTMVQSSSVKEPIPHLLLSNAVRPSAVALSKSLAIEYGPLGVRFNVVLPGSIDTERIRDLTRVQADARGVPFEEAMREREAAIPVGRIGGPREIGDVIAFLASPRASYVTGQALLVDGGVVRSVW